MVPKIEKGPGGGLFYLRSGVRFAVQGAGRTFCGIDLDVFAAGMILCICIGGGASAAAGMGDLFALRGCAGEKSFWFSMLNGTSDVLC